MLVKLLVQLVTGRERSVALEERRPVTLASGIEVEVGSKHLQAGDM